MSDIKETKTGYNFNADNAEPVKHGEWKYYNYYAGWYECTVCKQYEHIKHKFCPNCGADMRGETE